MVCASSRRERPGLGTKYSCSTKYAGLGDRNARTLAIFPNGKTAHVFIEIINSAASCNTERFLSKTLPAILLFIYLYTCVQSGPPDTASKSPPPPKKTQPSQSDGCSRLARFPVYVNIAWITFEADRVFGMVGPAWRQRVIKKFVRSRRPTEGC